MPTENVIRPSLSRKNSRPSLLSSLSSLHTNIMWHHNVLVEQQSPSGAKAVAQRISPGDNPTTLVRHDFFAAPPSIESPRSISSSSLSCSPSSLLSMPMSAKSPCFVHSHLDKGASLQDWLEVHGKDNEVLGSDVGVAKALQQHHRPQHRVELPRPDGGSHAFSENDDSDTYGGNLTKQLAETAVGVREMSKQLGRARIRSNIQSVLIVTKARDNRLIKLTRELALYLMLKHRQGDRGLIVYVDHQLRNSRRFDTEGIQRDHPELFEPLPRRRSSSSNSLSSLSSSSTHQDDFNTHQEGQLRYWTSDMCSNSPHLFDFVITLGGDGTVLFTSWLFQRIVPPVLPFALGSLGFLTNFDFADYQAVVDSAIDSGIRVNLRMRFTCTVYRAVFDKEKGRKAVKKGETGEIMMKDVNKGGWEALEGGWSGGFTTSEGGKCSRDKEIMCFTTRPVETFEVLNDLVVDRGPSPYVSLLELFGDEHHMTTVQADGLCVATPTGSTAYSLSAGGSLVHPEIPAILISPICPHTLSFRPMLLPDSMELRICVPYNSRSTAWVSFDGRGRVELQQGDHIKITASKYPFPTVCADKQSTDWFHAISRTLKWNERERQKSFVVVEEGPSRKSSAGKTRSPETTKQDVMFDENLEDEEDETTSDDEDDKFDIDDSSPEASTSGRTGTQIPNELKARDAAVGIAKAREETGSQTDEDLLSTPELAALALTQGRRIKFSRSAKSRSRSRPGLHSGVDTPGRFAGPTHRPPHIVSHHIDHQLRTPSPVLSNSSDDSLSNMDVAQRGARDDIHSREQYSSGRSRIPKDREFDDNLQTPTMADTPSRRRNHRRVDSRDYDQHHPRAFAVWGNDESDSNASDSDA
ncbi:ATP-NAD kinase-like domain-containing protein [Suillus subaureus]|uniref:ATP-NAD kinase-like domain-containing protein n=1 Tax=Suillus subaureus TaxID=48587 RepID=A0A9P7E7H6_9AGAM|nr:ATP-NAD kinase-like domain-containing protein [Suillus subaureus]KAG1812630.1 ATP-NAD kinase-like domain-containing protein [Suillus subaureus]